jgi:hypothetical protein
MKITHNGREYELTPEEEGVLGMALGFFTTCPKSGLFRAEENIARSLVKKLLEEPFWNAPS